MFFYKEKIQIDLLREIMRKGVCSSADLENIKVKIEENEKKIDEIKNKIASFLRKDAAELKLYDYLDYYMHIFPDRIVEKLSSGAVQSLLPQDIVQQIIEEDFDGVSIT